MKYKHVSYIPAELGEDGVDEELGLQELLLINGAVEEALELEVPEEVAFELPREKVILEVLREVSDYLLECKWMLLE